MGVTMSLGDILLSFDRPPMLAQTNCGIVQACSAQRINRCSYSASCGIGQSMHAAVFSSHKGDIYILRFLFHSASSVLQPFGGIFPRKPQKLPSIFVLYSIPLRVSSARFEEKTSHRAAPKRRPASHGNPEDSCSARSTWAGHTLNPPATLECSTIWTTLLACDDPRARCT